MNSFIETLFSPDIPFIRNALIAGLLSAILFGVLGSIITVRRISSLAGSISHAVLGGIGMALFLSSTNIIPNFPPILGAVIFALLAAVIIGFVSLKAKQREDTVINAIWAIGMSIGVLFMAKTKGYTDLSSYLFGNILLISSSDLILMAVLDAVLLFLVWRFYPHIEATSFDEEFSKVRRVPTAVFFLVLLCIIAIAIVLLQTFVGIVMVIAMLTLPAGCAAYSAKSLGGMMIFASCLSALFSVIGLILGWIWDVPVGSMVVVTAGVIFLSAAVMSFLRRKR
jgi:zinc transport system permease protein